MTRLAQQHGAINLAQGFPDFDGPAYIKDAAVRAILDGHNQYSRMFGVPEIAAAIADWWCSQTNQPIDPATQLAVTAGCTEALAAAFLGLLDPGDEVVLFEPYYDCYRAGVTMGGGVPKFVTLRPAAQIDEPHRSPAGPGAFAFDLRQLEAAFTPRTRLVILNTPHNPTGKAFSRAELELVARLCAKHDAVVVTDEVYERLTFTPELPHVRIATLPGMAERTLTLSSLGKTFSLTGWKIGWAVGSPPLIAALRSAHQFLTFCAATPLQHGAAEALANTAARDLYIADLVSQLSRERSFLSTALSELGFTVYPPDGTYFIMADHSRFGFPDDVAFCRHLTAEVGVAAIPPSVFYSNPADGARLARFAFCKQHTTMQQAVERLARLK
ncbi:MAG: aminotransferase class I/II-fold pyridoxal phosphate-dependent enzyme [Phycisphaerales bacterium]|nr:aminotransferase class I/II-fold pyridoxal phosphate-dependent enzyme [Phycisphaerales bacterium]